ncbi:hypothetical protein E9993_14505 [Labilibacter sediminis]|nr:hypothetical protein E9993_14505 [Labilibacter sediminis]
MLKSDQILSINLFSSILDHISDLVLGVEQIVGVYSSGDDINNLAGVCLEYRNNQLQERELVIKGEQQELKQMQLERNHYRWLDKSQVPFSSFTSEQSQLNIFSEYEHLVLLITLPHRLDNRKDLVFIYFKDDLNQFGVQHQKTPLSTQNKSVIGHLISSSAISFARMYWKQEDKLKGFAQKSKAIIESQRSVNKKDKRKEELEYTLMSWADKLLFNCSHSDHVNYVYSESAVEKIKNYSGNITILESAILEAVDYAKMIVTDVNCAIEGEFIVYDTDVNKETAPTQAQDISPRLQKSYDFLSKLEQNAIKVSQAGLNLTSYNVGQQMERPITPAAISDYISKNRDRINKLFKQYPNEWSFIRNNFRPIVNVVNYNSEKLKNWG